MDDENGTIGEGSLGMPPPRASRVRPDGSPGHKCPRNGCECWVHDSTAAGTRLCQPNCPGPTAAGPCCANGLCRSAATHAEVVATFDE
jgi:hypothetical protein